jgi:hypothetical protein
LTLVNFGIFPTAFLPFNLIAGPLMTLLGASIGALLVGHFGFGWSPAWLVHALEISIRSVLDWLIWWASQPFSVLETAYTSPLGWWVAMVSLMALGVSTVAPEAWLRQTLRWAGGMGLVVLPWLVLLRPPPTVLQWTWIRSGEPVWAIGTAEAVTCFATDSAGMQRCFRWAAGSHRQVTGGQYTIRVDRRRVVWKWGETKSVATWDDTGLGHVKWPSGKKMWWEAWAPNRSVEVEELGDGLVHIALPLRDVRNGQNGIDPVVPP